MKQTPKDSHEQGRAGHADKTATAAEPIEDPAVGGSHPEQEHPSGVSRGGGMASGAVAKPNGHASSEREHETATVERIKAASERRLQPQPKQSVRINKRRGMAMGAAAKPKGHASNGFSNAPWPRSAIQFNGPPPTAENERDQGQTTFDKHGSVLLEVWPILRRNKLSIFAITLLGAVAGLLFTIPQTPTYQARAAIEIQSLNENFLNLKEIDPTALTSSTSGESYVHTQVKILQSQSLIGRVVDKLNLQHNPEFAAKPSRISSLRQVWRVGAARPIDAKEHAVNIAASHLQVRILGQTRIAEVLFDSIDPKLAADFANVLASEFILQNLEAHWQTTQNTGKFLTTQLEDLKANLEKSDDGLQTYARAAGLMFTSEKDSVAEKKLRQIQEELSTAQADRVAKQSQLELANTASSDTLPDVLNDLTLRDYEVKLTDLRRQLAELSSLLTPNNSKVQRVQAEISELEKAVKTHEANLVTRVRNNYHAAMTRERLLTTDFANQSKIVADQTEKAIHYNILKRDVETNRQLYEAILQRMKEAGVSAAMRASNIRVVDMATPPSRPYKPDLLSALGVGLFMGLAFGIGGVLIRERLDRTLHQPGDASLYLSIPELGVIPSAKAEFARRSIYSGKSIRANTTDLVIGNGNGRKANNVELITWQSTSSMMAEAFHATLTSILLTGDNGSRPRVLMFTSPGSGEGKTTVVCNLGIALAELRQRVLLIDGDMRRPRLHTVFGLDNDSGFSDLLHPNGSEYEKPMRLVQKTEIPGLYVLCSGPATNGTHNLLHSDQVSQIIEMFRSHFDTIIIDTPPMLPMSDARVLAGFADGVVLVIRLGKTTRDAAIAARDRFAGDGTPVMGAILNDWDPKASSSYGVYGSSYSNYYRRDEPAQANE